MDTLNTKHGTVHVCSTAEELADGAAREFVRVMQEGIKERGRATVALSGGNTPRILYERLLQPDLRAQIDWSKVHFFMGDERSVPKDSSESNWGNAWRQFLSKLDLPADNLHPMHSQDIYPEQCAAGYEAEIRNFFNIGPNEIPSFDLILLGMGPDGHCASLFPDTKALDEGKRLVVDNRVEKLNTTRITFTFPLINHARTVMFMIEGENKSKVLAEALHSDTVKYPVQRIKPINGHVDWFVDKAAAQDLLNRV